MVVAIHVEDGCARRDDLNPSAKEASDLASLVLALFGKEIPDESTGNARIPGR